MNIGLFGGSFNPVHLGHLLVARAALEELDLDRVCFIPAAQSPFKPGASMAPAPSRLCMLRLAMAGEGRFHLDNQEIQRGGVSYTVTTVAHYANAWPGAGLCWLIGADLVAQLPQWREAEKLAALAEFVVVTRPGEAPARLPPPYRLRAIRGVPFGVSSSEIRDRVKRGRSIDWLTPPAVVEYIRNHRLYQ